MARCARRLGAIKLCRLFLFIRLFLPKTSLCCRAPLLLLLRGLLSRSLQVEHDASSVPVSPGMARLPSPPLSPLSPRLLTCRQCLLVWTDHLHPGIRTLLPYSVPPALHVAECPPDSYRAAPSRVPGLWRIVVVVVVVVSVAAGPHCFAGQEKPHAAKCVKLGALPVSPFWPLSRVDSFAISSNPPPVFPVVAV